MLGVRHFAHPAYVNQEKRGAQELGSVRENNFRTFPEDGGLCSVDKVIFSVFLGSSVLLITYNLLYNSCIRRFKVTYHIGPTSIRRT